MTAKSEYEVGYKKPPKHAKWKAGQSGNPHGRPKRKKPRSFAELLLKALEMPVRLRDEDGTVRVVTAREALVEQLFQEALLGDMESVRLLEALRKKSEATAPPPDQNMNFRIVLVHPDNSNVRRDDAASEAAIIESATEPEAMAAAPMPRKEANDYYCDMRNVPAGVVVRGPAWE